MSNNTEQTKFKPVTRELVEGMVAAIQRINQIHSSVVKKVTDEGEIEAATTYLAQNFLQHAGEFLGTWITVANEYEPLVSAWAGFNNRVAGFIAAKQRSDAEKLAEKIGPKPTEAETGGKVIVPTNFNRSDDPNGNSDKKKTE